MADERMARQRAAELGSTSVNGFTRASMRLPCARLEPYKDTRPRPEMRLAERRQRLEEITAQAHYETQDRFISVDPELYQVAQQPSPWGDVDFALTLPLPVLLSLLQAGYDPASEADRRAYSRARARAPLLSNPELAAYTDRGGSLSASLDNVPARATRRGTRDILMGEYSVLVQTDA